MSIVVLKLPDVKSEAEGRPQRCPSCKGETFQRWGGQMRKIWDPRVRYVMVYLSMLWMQTYLSALSARSRSGAAEPAVAQACSVGVGVGVELPGDRSSASGLWGRDWADECLAG
jgi:hypothetical protein